MKITILSVFSSLLLFIHAGCSNNSFSNGVIALSLMDPNHAPYSIETIDRSDGTRDLIWKNAGRIEQKNPCRIKYHNSYFTNRYMVVEGRLENSEIAYPVVLDTGASQPVFVNLSHVMENNLAILPLEDKSSNANGHSLGLCDLSRIQIGNATLANWPCLYLEQSTRSGLFGLSIANSNSLDNTVIVGMPILREFKYLMFDNIAKEVEFSYNELFNPVDANRWQEYTIDIEEDFHGNVFLFVNIPIASEQVVLQLDTGSGKGLAITEELYQRLKTDFNRVKLKNGKDIYPYIGQLRCKKGSIDVLEFGNRSIRNADISVFPDDSLLLQESQGLVGMQYFQDTTVVLDFGRNLLWVKKLQ